MRRVATIPVVTAPPTGAGRLHGHYDVHALFLRFQSRGDAPHAFGFTVGGSARFDCTAGGVLTAGLVNIRRELWEPAALPPWPHDVAQADVVVDRSLERRTVEGPARCSCDARRTSVVVHLGIETPDRAVALGADCLALLADSTLVGLWLRSVLEVGPGGGFGASIDGVSHST